MRHVILFVSLLALLAGSAAHAQETPSQEGETQSDDEANAPTEVGPPLFECERLSWLDSCKQINRQFRVDPNTHLRITTRDGVELNFPPNTPTAAIRFYTLQTPEAAEAYVRHMRQKIDHSKRSAKMLGRARQRMGIKTSAAAIIGDQPMSPKRNSELPIGKLKLFVFYSSTDSASESLLSEIKRLQFNYPELYISALQLDKDPSLLTRYNKRFGLDARILDGQAREVWTKRIDHFPATIIEDTHTGKQVKVRGEVSMKRLMAALKGLANGET